VIETLILGVPPCPCMIPFRDVIPARTAPTVTVGLIGLHAAVFLVTPSALLSGGAVTSLFLHDGWVHLISNLWALWLFGDNVEAKLGRWLYLLLYFLSAGTAALAQSWMAPEPLLPLLGPGGAIAGVIGAYAVLYPQSRILVFVPRLFYIDLVETPAVAIAGFWFATQMLLTIGRLGDPAIDGGVTLVAYVSGFLAGAGLVWVLGQRRRDSRWWSEF